MLVLILHLLLDSLNILIDDVFKARFKDYHIDENIFPSLLDSLNILTDDVFKVRFKDYHIDENIFPSLGEEILIPKAW